MRIEKLLRGVIVAASLAVTATTATVAQAKDKYVIALCMPFQTNGWQKGIQASAQWAVDELNNAGHKVELKVVDAAGDTQTQLQQINNLVLEGVDYILLEPLSDTALNSAVDNAVDAGIPVIAMATGRVTTSKAKELQFDFDLMASKYITYLAERLGGKGNALNIRGLAGAESEKAIQAAYERALKKYPNIKIVSEVYGDWNQSTAQQRVAAVLPTLPRIDMIFSQGNAAFGAAQAFITAGKDVPPQVYGLDGAELNLLRDLNAKNGYVSIATNNDPGIASVAVNVAFAELNGIEAPQEMISPVPEITIEDIKTKYATIADNDIVFGKYSYDWVLENILKAKK
jgi:ribose transport system substrate-binding protein